MNVHERGFDYALEPLLRRRRWQLESAQARLGSATRKVAEALEAVERREARLLLEHAQASAALSLRLDPAKHRNSLQWLSQLREEIVAARAEHAALVSRREAAAAECRKSQVALEVVEKHRADTLAEHAKTREGQLAAAADADWLGRSGWRQAQ
ncbi:MAG TPA: hypothetical protein VNB23_07330 [Ramlibacter sp.]|nr:hypothetical protein [Ramlibacter sp.]